VSNAWKSNPWKAHGGTAAKRRLKRYRKMAASAVGFADAKGVEKLFERYSGKKDLEIVVDDAMLSRRLQPSPVEGTRSRSVYRQATKKVLAGRNIKVVHSPKPVPS
jgi:hypothetical protein